MIHIGLSGNRYSGKDTISKLFQQIGIPVFNADVVLRFILSHNYEIQNDIIQSIGYKHFNSAGKLSPLTITDEKTFNRVIDLVEKDLFDHYYKFSQKTGSVYAIFHSSILFERGWQKKFDYNINVFAPFKDRLERCKRSNNDKNKLIKSENKDFKRIIQSHDMVKLSSTEMKDLDKNSLADWIIHNYESVSIVMGSPVDQVSQIDQQIIDQYLKLEKKSTHKNLAL
jgi:dephospho-CoA kinase